MLGCKETRGQECGDLACCECVQDSCGMYTNEEVDVRQERSCDFLGSRGTEEPRCDVSEMLDAPMLLPDIMSGVTKGENWKANSPLAICTICMVVRFLLSARGKGHLMALQK